MKTLSPEQNKQNQQNKDTMKITRHLKLIIVIATVALLSGLTPAQAGSTKPNPAGLAKAAAAKVDTCRVGQNEMSLFVNKLAKGGEFTQQVDLAVYRKDTKQLVKLVREAGVRRSKITVEEMRPDFFFRLKLCFSGFCGSIEFGW
jgi:hypothetical protein